MTHKISMLTMMLLAVAMAMAGIGGAVDASAAPTPASLAWAPTTSSGTYDYGTVVAGATKSVTFTLTNTGGKATGRLRITLSGPSAFTITQDGCNGTSLGPNKSCTDTIEYAPTNSGQRTTATLSASGKSASASLTLIGKTGVGAAPNLTLSPGTYQTSANGTNYYRYLFSGSGSATTRFTVTNSSDFQSQPLTIQCESVRPDNDSNCSSQPFTLVNSTCIGRILNIGDSCTFDLKFTPLATCPPNGYLARLDVDGYTYTTNYIEMDVYGTCS